MTSTPSSPASLPSPLWDFGRLPDVVKTKTGLAVSSPKTPISGMGRLQTRSSPPSPRTRQPQSGNVTTATILNPESPSALAKLHNRKWQEPKHTQLLDQALV